MLEDESDKKLFQNVFERYYELFLDVYEHFDDVSIRLLDIPSDELIPSESKYDSIRESNPFMGANRACRQAIRNFNFYDVQINSAIKASKNKNKELKIMAPLVSSIDESLYIKNKIKTKTKDFKYGIMIETPAALLQISEFAKLLVLKSTDGLFGPANGPNRIHHKHATSNNMKSMCTPHISARSFLTT